MINNVYFNNYYEDKNFFNISTSIYKNLPENIDVFSELNDVSGKVSEYTRKSYNRLIETIKRYIDMRDSIYPLENNLSKLKNYIDDDKEIFIEWIVRNNFRIGFDIDKNGNISFWKIYKNGTSTNTISDCIEESKFEEQIASLINEVMNLT